MSYSAQIVDGIVAQVIVGGAEWATSNLGGIWVAVGDVYPGPGWTYDGTTFEAPYVEPTDEELEPNP
jgi:hypothetical protein